MTERLKSTSRMSPIVVHKDTIYLSGQVAALPDTDIGAQTKACLEKVEGLLGEVGGSCDNILSALIHISDMGNFAAMNEVWDGWFENRPKPARTCVEAKLARPEILVEITVVAERPS